MTEVGCWRDQAACRDVVTADYDPFFADTPSPGEAIAICAALPGARCLPDVRGPDRPAVRHLGRPTPADDPPADRLDRAGRPHGRRAPAGHPQASKTHCKRGHPFDAETPTTPRMASAAAAPACARPSPPDPEGGGSDAA